MFGKIGISRSKHIEERNTNENVINKITCELKARKGCHMRRSMKYILDITQVGYYWSLISNKTDLLCMVTRVLFFSDYSMQNKIWTWKFQRNYFHSYTLEVLKLSEKQLNLIKICHVSYISIDFIFFKVLKSMHWLNSKPLFMAAWRWLHPLNYSVYLIFYKIFHMKILQFNKTFKNPWYLLTCNKVRMISLERFYCHQN